MPLPPRPQRQALRTSFAEITPAVLRCQNGSRLHGKLQIISLSGGLLGMPKPLDRGTQVRLMFLTEKGSVFGAAEMLSPISWIQQPFKFTKLYVDDQKRLNAAIQSSIAKGRRDCGQMEATRAW